MSAVIRVSSISSHAASSRVAPDSRLSRTDPRATGDRASRPRRRASRPADGAGWSSGRAGGAAGSAVTLSSGMLRSGTLTSGGARVSVLAAGGAAAAGGSAVVVPAVSGELGAPGWRRERNSATRPAPPPPPATMTMPAMMSASSMTPPSVAVGPGELHPWLVTRSGGLALPEALADHAGDAVAAHADPVQRVGDLHRPLLVGDHDQLGALPQLREDVQQPAEVGVVQRGFDLVEDVERRRPGHEDGDQERDRGERALPAGQQGQALDLLARRAGLEVDAGGQHVVGLGEEQAAVAAGEQQGEEPL